RYVYTDYRGLNWQAIHDEYAPKIKAAPSEEDVYNLIAEMIQKLGDRHSGYANPRDVTEDDALQRGDLQLSGIGVISQQIEKAVRIIYVIPGSPADRAGLRPFDVVQSVDGTPLLENGDAPRLIRGPAGTSVTLTVLSPGKAPRNVTIVRANVTFAFHVSDQRLPGTNIAYLNMPTFNSFGIAQEVHDELTKLASTGPLDGLVIDLRQNGGGLLVELQDTLKLFIDGGNAGYEATRGGRQADTIPVGQTLPALRGKPIVVLVSGLCESACERFAVAMHDRQRATIVGTTTAGNTETVYPYDLQDGSRLYLASATYQRPDGTSIEDKGLPPDITVDVPWYQYQLDQDPQVLQAIKSIQGK
ncbi:MAG: S41 family peptidase, partial [Chloroflexota bacterium]|nr:S41 family peptidase [Chloroflexota bacterium]